MTDDRKSASYVSAVSSILYFSVVHSEAVCYLPPPLLSVRLYSDVFVYATVMSCPRFEF